MFSNCDELDAQNVLIDEAFRDFSQEDSFDSCDNSVDESILACCGSGEDSDLGAASDDWMGMEEPTIADGVGDIIDALDMNF